MKNRGVKYSISEVRGWKESGDTSVPTTTKDLDTLVKEIDEMEIDDEKYPKRYFFRYIEMEQVALEDALSC